MGLSDMAQAKAQAKISELEAQLTAAQEKLRQAQEDREAAAAEGELLESVERTPIVGDLTADARGNSTVDQANAQAEVDRWQAVVSTVQAKLTVAIKAREALDSIIGPQK